MEATALELVKTAIEAADPYKAVRSSLRLEGDEVVIQDRHFPVKGRIYVLAFGKAACGMAGAAFDVLGDRIAEAVIATKHGYASGCPHGDNVHVIEAGHPLLDENSLLAGKLGLELAQKIEKEDILLVLISGGGSAIFELPEDGITLKDLIETSDLLLRSGAKIHEINTVRKHISRVKGGKLAKHVKGTLVSLIISDVVGDNLEAIASGPTVKDPTTFSDAHAVLLRYGIWERLPVSVRRHIELGLKGEREETLKTDLPNVHNFIIGSVERSCTAVKEKAEKLGFNARILTTVMEGEAREVGTFLGCMIQEIHRRNRPFRKPAVLIMGGETTVNVGDAGGLGGPSQELALSAARKISGLEGTVLVAFDTDGTDGPTDAAGGIVDGSTYEKLKKAGIDVDEVLKNHDAYHALERVGALLRTGPTGTNVNSMVIAIIRGE
ncbi:glycerate kinase type-2 family protein [Thermococcus sp.]